LKLIIATRSKDYKKNDSPKFLTLSLLVSSLSIKGMRPWRLMRRDF
jgi:hypothetical protein